MPRKRTESGRPTRYNNLGADPEFPDTFVDEPDERYLLKVKATIIAADKRKGEGYVRGITESEVNRRLGKHANRDWTHKALRSMELFVSGIPERYSGVDYSVRVIPQSEWHRYEPVINRYNFNMNAFPENATKGIRDR